MKRSEWKKPERESEVRQAMQANTRMDPRKILAAMSPGLEYNHDDIGPRDRQAGSKQKKIIVSE